MNSLNSPSDVRMRGFLERCTVNTAWQWVDEHARALESERIALSEAAGRVLARDVISQHDVPRFARAMMDGYALQAADTVGASPYNPLSLQVIGQVMPGQPFAGTLRRRQAVQIMTGAPLPDGCDAVLPVERTQREDERVSLLGEVSPGKHVGQRGEDIRQGQLLLRSGRRLRPQDVGVLSSIGVGALDVVRTPRVRIVITGSELLPSGEAPRDHQIVDANGPMLGALVQRDGGHVTTNAILPDDAGAILSAMQDPVDVVLVSGGSSVGVEDHAPRLIAAHGELPIHGIAMRPSSPAGMGTIQGHLVFLLPGNPVSCLCAYDFFAGRAIRRLAGRTGAWPYRSVRLPLRRKLVSQIGRMDYARVTIQDGEVEPLAISGASMLSSTTRADGFVIIPGDSEGYPAGHEAEVFLYDS